MNRIYFVRKNRGIRQAHEFEWTIWNGFWIPNSPECVTQVAIEACEIADLCRCLTFWIALQTWSAANERRKKRNARIGAI